MDRRRARIVAMLVVALLGVGVLARAEALACPPACCCPALEGAGVGCEALSTVPCCHAAGAPVAPTTSAPAPSPAAAPALEVFTIAPKLRAASPALPLERAGRLPSPLRLSVVLRI